MRVVTLLIHSPDADGLPPVLSHVGPALAGRPDPRPASGRVAVGGGALTPETVRHVLGLTAPNIVPTDRSADRVAAGNEAIRGRLAAQTNIGATPVTDEGNNVAHPAGATPIERSSSRLIGAFGARLPIPHGRVIPHSAVR